MLRWTVRMLITVIASVLLVSAGGAAAGALAANTGVGVVVSRPGDPAPVVIPSPERPAAAVGLPQVPRPE